MSEPAGALGAGEPLAAGPELDGLWAAETRLRDRSVVVDHVARSGPALGSLVVGIQELAVP